MNLVGIDLGTTYSAIAHLDNNGNPVIIRNALEEADSSITPSVVLFESENDVIVGRIAKNVVDEEANAFQLFKRHMGSGTEYQTDFGKVYTPTTLSSFVIKKLKEYAEDQIGKISEAVITVPAMYAVEQREATIEAAKMAGIKVKNIIDEPTAAALYYASSNPLDGTCAVYDLGGGTFDISVIEVNGTDINVLCADGNGHLGGNDFDECLVELVKEKFKNETGIELPGDKFTQAMAEERKKTLSIREKTTISIRHSGKNARLTITRSDFEEAIGTLIAKSELSCENLLRDELMKGKKIQQVILAGQPECPGLKKV